MMEWKEGSQLELTKAACLATVGGYMVWLFFKDYIIDTLLFLAKFGLGAVILLFLWEVLASDNKSQPELD